MISFHQLHRFGLEEFSHKGMLIVKMDILLLMQINSYIKRSHVGWSLLKKEVCPDFDLGLNFILLV